MKRTTAFYVVTVIVALSLADQAFAMSGKMGNGMRQGNAGGNHQMRSQMHQGGMAGMQPGSGNGGGPKREVMHEAGSQLGHMNGSGQQRMMTNADTAGSADSQPATLPTATTLPANN